MWHNIISKGGCVIAIPKYGNHTNKKEHKKELNGAILETVLRTSFFYHLLPAGMVWDSFLDVF